MNWPKYDKNEKQKAYDKIKNTLLQIHESETKIILFILPSIYIGIHSLHLEL